MVDRDLVLKLVDEALSETEGYYLVDLTISPTNAIQIEIDNINGRVSIEDCVKVSRKVEFNLDREKEDFELMVSSAGLDKPLRVLNQFIKATGKPVKVISNNGERIEGELTHADEKEFIIESKSKEKIEGRKKKEWVIKKHTLSYDEIKEVKRVISFK